MMSGMAWDILGMIAVGIGAAAGGLTGGLVAWGVDSVWQKKNTKRPK